MGETLCKTNYIPNPDRNKSYMSLGQLKIEVQKTYTYTQERKRSIIDDLMKNGRRVKGKRQQLKVEIV